MSHPPDFWILPYSFDLAALQARFGFADTPFAKLRARAGWLRIAAPDEIERNVRDAVSRGFGTIIVVLPFATDDTRERTLQAVMDLPAEAVTNDLYSYDLEEAARTIAIDFRGADDFVSEAYLRDGHDLSVVPIDARFFNGKQALEAEYKAAFIEYWRERRPMLEAEFDELDEPEDMPKWSDAARRYFADLGDRVADVVSGWLSPAAIPGMVGASDEDAAVVVSRELGDGMKLQATLDPTGTSIKFDLRLSADASSTVPEDFHAFTLWFDAFGAFDDDTPDFNVTLKRFSSSPLRFDGTLDLDGFRNPPDKKSLPTWLDNFEITVGAPAAD